MKLLTALLLSLAGCVAQAQSWPTKTVKIIAPVQPGGGFEST